ncbi:MAG: M48 family metalloprotease [Chloroherpetonaceae bacterium]|nr:M48 family metalloprotease [Chloroherpetonaceae bacterium]
MKRLFIVFLFNALLFEHAVASDKIYSSSSQGNQHLALIHFSQHSLQPNKKTEVKPKENVTKPSSKQKKSSWGNEIVYTKRSNNAVRSGAGAFFPVVATVPENMPLKVMDRGEKWLKVQLPDKKEGWIAENCLVDRPTDANASKRLASSWSGGKASRAGVAAAVKGFAGKFGKTNSGNVNAVFEYAQKGFTLSEYTSFNSPISRAGSTNRGKFTLGSAGLSSGAYDVRFAEQQIGAGIAARIIATKGLYNDRALHQYLNLICTSIAMNSESYDVDFTVYILNDNLINAFALPGGYIFVTTGLIKACQDEAELATVIAHEMGHVILRHGLQELSKRIAKIRAEILFDELDAEFEDERDEEEKEMEAELDNIAEEAYERCIGRRLMQYEFEADKAGAVLSANAGYDPTAIVRMLRTVSGIQASQPKPESLDSEYFNTNEYKLRISGVESFISVGYNSSGATLRDRFNSRTSKLR